MSKPVTTQRNKSGAPNLREVGSTPEPRIRRKEAKASPETSAQPTPASSARIAAPGEQAVRFDLFDPNARRAFLVGTFNDWQPGVTR